jgi:O-antigen/teichoic acid export membrane protein
LAFTGSHYASSPAAALSLRWLRSRLGLGPGEADHRLAQRLAGTVFMIRVASAVLAFGSQVLLARWMGSFEFGVYVYVWTWVLLIGQPLHLGLGTAAQRFIPEYRESGMLDRLRGFLSGSRWIAFAGATGVAAVCALGVRLLSPWLDHYLIIPLYLACISLPAYALAITQDGIARSHDWMGLSMVPTYVVRQTLLTGLMAAGYVAHLPMTAETAMIMAAASIWLPTLGQLFVLNARLAACVAPGPKSYAVGVWLTTAFPILLVEGFYLLLTYVDVLLLQQFRPPDEVAVYYAAAKTLALVSFVYYAVSASTAHRFSEYDVAGDQAGLTAFIRLSIKWTFWPSVAATALLLALGRPLLSLFGPQFSGGYRLMFILAIGLLARAAIGPIERLLNMLGQQRACALVYGAAFAINFVGCLALIPLFGTAGAAVATSLSLIVESIMLFKVTKSRLGFHVFIWGVAENESAFRSDRS